MFSQISQSGWPLHWMGGFSKRPFQQPFCSNRVVAVIATYLNGVS